MLNVSFRNVCTFTFTFVICILVIIVAIKMLLNLHVRDEDNNKKISLFFRILPTICAIGIFISSIAICVGQGLWLFCSLWTPWITAYTTLQHGITFLLVGIIFVGRLYFTFENSPYAYPKKLYILLIIYFSVLIGTGVVVTAVGNTTEYISAKLYTALLICVASTFVVSASMVVLLFIHTMRKVRLHC